MASGKGGWRWSSARHAECQTPRLIVLDRNNQARYVKPDELSHNRALSMRLTTS